LAGAFCREQVLSSGQTSERYTLAPLISSSGGGMQVLGRF
jgi:hypothetical protein